MNINQRTIDALYELVKEAFEKNRLIDRLVSVLGVNFACNNLAKKIHTKIAHRFPSISDEIGETCLERYNITVEYGSTLEGKQDYSSVTEIIEVLEQQVIEYQNLLIGAMKVAFVNDDLQVYSELSKIMIDYNLLVEQVILLNDKIGFYKEENTMLFDSDSDKFWIL